MVITVLEGRVKSEKQSILKSAYSSAIEKLDAGIVETFLSSDARDPDVWRINYLIPFLLLIPGFH